MYLKFIRHHQLCGNLCRGSLYSVHFQPNEKGGYNEHLTSISDAYEIGSAPALIYPAGVRQKNGRLRLSFGLGMRMSSLHLIDHVARDTFFVALREAFAQHEDVRIEVGDMRGVAMITASSTKK